MSDWRICLFIAWTHQAVDSAQARSGKLTVVLDVPR